MIEWRPFVAVEDHELDEGLRVALNSLGQWAEKRRISLFAGHAHGIDLHLRLKSALLLALDEATAVPLEYQQRSKPDRPRKVQPQGDANRPIGMRRAEDLQEEN